MNRAADVVTEAVPAGNEAAALVRDQGFAVITEVVDPAIVTTMRGELQRCVDEDLARWNSGDAGRVDAWMVHNLMLRADCFADFLENPALHSCLTPLLGDTCIVYAYTSSSMPPGASNYSNRIHTDCPRVIPGYVTNVGFICALDDFSEENGGTRFLPRSFERIEPPDEEEFLRDGVLVLPRAGQGVVFNARLWHCGGANGTRRPRHAITLNVCRAYMRQRFDYPRMTPPVLYERLGEVGRRFLGFNVRVPTGLEEYYLPEGQRLYKAGQG